MEGQLTDFIPAGNRAVVAWDYKWPDDGEHGTFYQVVTMRAGRVVDIQDHESKTSALESVGLAT